MNIEQEMWDTDGLKQNLTIGWMVLTLISLLTVDNIIYSDNVLLANAYGNSLGQIKTK